jgi:hypothetical protein
VGPRGGLEAVVKGKILSPCQKLNPIFFQPFVIYGYETCSSLVRERHRLRMFENKLLRKILGSGRDEVTKDWREIHNDQLHQRKAGHTTHGATRNAYNILVGKSERKRPLGRPWCRWRMLLKWILGETMC